MIHFAKPNEIPQVLLNHGSARTQQDCQAYADDSTAYDSGDLTFEFSNHIYGATEVRDLLKELQHNKCCYCESKTSPGRIDHYRPKGAVRQSEESARVRPGYYWLAYGWDNLVLACEDCNRKKSDLFPLEDTERRARNHLDRLDLEAPLLLNPYVEMNPDAHLTFVGPACHPRTTRGRITATLLELNRPMLQEERQRILSDLECLWIVVRDPNTRDALRHTARDRVDALARPDSPYSSMVRDYLRAVEAED